MLCFVRVFGRSGQICAFCELDSGHVVSEVSQRSSRNAAFKSRRSTGQVVLTFGRMCVILAKFATSGQFGSIFDHVTSPSLRERSTSTSDSATIDREFLRDKCQSVWTPKLSVWTLKTVCVDPQKSVWTPSGKCPKMPKFSNLG